MTYQLFMHSDTKSWLVIGNAGIILQCIVYGLTIYIYICRERFCYTDILNINVVKLIILLFVGGGGGVLLKKFFLP